MKADKVALEAKLSKLTSKYPPRLFRDVSELKDWLATQPNPAPTLDAALWYKHGRELQMAAAKDGYIISVMCMDFDRDGLFTVGCLAVLQDGSLYAWDPETDRVFYVDNVWASKLRDPYESYW